MTLPFRRFSVIYFNFRTHFCLKPLIVFIQVVHCHLTVLATITCWGILQNLWNLVDKHFSLRIFFLYAHRKFILCLCQSVFCVHVRFKWIFLYLPICKRGDAQLVGHTVYITITSGCNQVAYRLFQKLTDCWSQRWLKAEHPNLVQILNEVCNHRKKCQTNSRLIVLSTWSAQSWPHWLCTIKFGGNLVLPPDNPPN